MSALSKSSVQPVVVMDPGTAIPDGHVEELLDAFWSYEAALAADDLDALDLAFTPGDDTLRGDAAGLLVGHDSIRSFRGSRGGAPAREITSLHLRLLGAERALIVSENAPLAGGRGLVTQLWRRGPAGWQIETAQVAASAPALNTSVWRVVGNPLVAPIGHGTGEADAGARPLEGETVAVKDLFALEGFAIGAGVPEYLAGSPRSATTAPAVQLLLDAGAAVRGIAQTDEFAYSIAGRNSHYGTPPNARVPGGVPGGSSSGPGAAVALGHATIGLGTDTGGSIRVPASYQGLWGLRTTHGAVPREQLLPLAPSFDTVGWLTREPAVLRAAASVSLSGAEQRPLEDARFAVSSRLIFAADDAVQASFVGTVDRLAREGRIAAPELVDVGELSALLSIFRTVQAAEAWAIHGEWITAHPGALGADVAARFELASRISAEEEVDARSAAADARERLDDILDGRILLLPSASSGAPRLTADPAELDATRTSTMSLTCVAGLGGYPALSVPLLEAAGAPVGLCLVGPPFSDLALIDLAASFCAKRA